MLDQAGMGRIKKSQIGLRADSITGLRKPRKYIHVKLNSLICAYIHTYIHTYSTYIRTYIEMQLLLSASLLTNTPY